MNKFIAVIALVFGFATVSMAQVNKVDWDTKVTKVSKNTYQVDVIANVANGWFIYSKDMKEGGPIPTSVELKGSGFTTSGSLKESGKGLKTFYDDIFEVEIKKYGGKVVYTQMIKVNSTAPTINANVLFMSCDDQRCLPPKRLNLPVQF